MKSLQDKLDIIKSYIKLDAIRLTDVMVSLRDKKHGGYAIDQDGLFIRIRKNHEYGWDKIEGYSTPPCWNIYKDSLVEQSEETIDFIYNYLK